MGEIFPLSLGMLQQQKLAPGLTETYLRQLALLCQKLGFALTWGTCSVCGTARPPASRPQYFSTSAGGIVCTPCTVAGRASPSRLSPATAALIGSVLMPADDPAEVSVPAAPLSDRLEVLSLLHRFLVHHMEHPLKTWEFLKNAVT